MSLCHHLHKTIKGKKLVSVLVTFILVINISKELILGQITYIWYLVKFQKMIKIAWVLIDFGNKINIITLAYAAVLDLKIYPIAIGT